ncbi:MalT transcriptional regulator family protein [endosymbiont of unidentified scaly snail isolate Monju]|uniref:ATP-binding protein n=1 Tax=endosymbiont of unidentified scaly snail isolate Monju TaxID=1248727 RepID=UPI0003892559|nr:ATP-binding protein [endosymbiont of unidentified scaly snail isolate Monju]BAN69028.1 hypothetical protein EBS_1109 [endosymbiont of unidentified scaly snail isolate Monju]
MTENPHADLLQRERLLTSLLESLKQARLAGLVAPAGSGKTVAARQLSARWTQTVLWLDISAGHNDPVVLFSSLFKRFTAQIPGFRDATLERMLRAGEMTPADLSVPMAHLLRAMERTFPNQMLVVLDDLHLLTTTPACELLADLIRRAPAGWHWLFCHRPALSGPLGGLLTPGRSVVLGEADLRFSHEEVDRLYRDCFGIALSADQVQRLLDDTGGHALMVGLCRLGTRGIQSLIEYLEFTLPSTHWHHLLCWSLLPAEGAVDLDHLLGAGASRLLQELVGKVPGFHVGRGEGASVCTMSCARPCRNTLKE